MNQTMIRTKQNLICLALGLMAWPSVALELEVTSDRVVLQDHSAAGVAIVGAYHEASDSDRVLRKVQVVDSELVLDSEIAVRSIWVAVDLGSGENQIHTPKDVVGTNLYTPEFQSSALRYFDRLGLLGDQLDLVVVRQGGKGVAVWYGRFSEQQARSRDRNADWLNSSISDLARVNPGKGKLNRLKSGDLVIGFEAQTLAHFTVEIGE